MPIITNTEYTALPPWLQQAYRDMTERAEAIRKAPYQRYEGERIAPLNQDIVNAHGLGRRTNTYQPYINRSEQLLNRGSENFADNYRRYMDPYQQAVVDRIATEGNRNLTENIMPMLEAKFVGLGQHGGTRHATLANRAARDIQGEISASQAKALSHGYQNASQIFNQDKARELAAGREISNLGGLSQAGRLTDITMLMDQGRYNQSQDQAKKEIAYKDFLKQQAYPQEQLADQATIMHGMPLAGQKLNVQKTPELNMAGQLAPLAMNIYGARMMAGKKRGGYVGYARGGYVPDPRDIVMQSQGMEGQQAMLPPPANMFQGGIQNESPLEPQRQMLPPDNPNPIEQGANAGMMSAQRSMGMNEAEKRRAMGAAMMGFANSMSNVNNYNGSGLAGTLGAMNASFNPALKAYQDQEAIMLGRNREAQQDSLAREKFEEDKRYNREILNLKRSAMNPSVSGDSLESGYFSQFAPMKSAAERNRYAKTLHGTIFTKKALDNINKDFTKFEEITKDNALLPTASLLPGANKMKDAALRVGMSLSPDSKNIKALNEEVTLRKRLQSEFSRLEPILENALKGGVADAQLLRRFHELGVYMSSNQPMNIIRDRLDELMEEVSQTQDIAEASLKTGRHVKSLPDVTDIIKMQDPTISDEALAIAKKQMSRE